MNRPWALERSGPVAEALAALTAATAAATTLGATAQAISS
jgi:hypothetical protein